MKRPKSIDLRAQLMNVIVGMAKDAGYDQEAFITDAIECWPLVSERKIPERSEKDPPRYNPATDPYRPTGHEFGDFLRKLE
jgi:hypothetical protein